MRREPEIYAYEMATFRQRHVNLTYSIKQMRDTKTYKGAGSLYPIHSITLDSGVTFGYRAYPDLICYLYNDVEFWVVREQGLPHNIKLYDDIDKLYGEFMEFLHDYFNEDWE